MKNLNNTQTNNSPTTIASSSSSFLITLLNIVELLELSAYGTLETLQKDSFVDSPEAILSSSLSDISEISEKVG